MLSGDYGGDLEGDDGGGSDDGDGGVDAGGEHNKGSHPLRKVQFFLTLFKRGGGGRSNPCSKIMSEIVVCSGGHLTT